MTSAAWSEWFRENGSRFSGQILFDEPLSKHTYYRIGGPARVLALPKTLEDLKLLADGIRSVVPRIVILGLGSNVLVSDEGVDALVIRSSRINLDISEVGEPDAEGNVTIRTGASVAVSTLLRRAVQEGWAGLEFLTGIPGSIGGVIRMNAGTHLGEAKDALHAVEAFSLREPDGGLHRYTSTDFQFAYRKNLFLPQDTLVWSAEWRVKKDDPAKVKAVIDETLVRRKATQPIDYPSCGSVFKNPRESGMSAWQVVDKLGLRGQRIGDAQFAEKHSNFIINLGGAKASDVQELIKLAKRRAFEELDICLEEEVIYLRDQ